jgi:protease IV
MKRIALLALSLAGSIGCLHPIRTEDCLHVDGPVVIKASAELDPKNNAPPLEPMPVAGKSLPSGGPKVAILDVDGLLLNLNLTGPYSTGENPVDLFREKLDRAAADPCVCAVVVRINSPGGAVTATDVMWHDLQAFRERTHRPVVACLMDLGCSGGYYLATASDVILANPTTITGGIGVVMNVWNLEDALGTFNIRTQFIKAGPHIDTGNMAKHLDPESRRLLQRMADQLHERFQYVVRRQRPRLDPAEGTTMDGRILSASEALDLGLIDRIGYLDDAIETARQLAGQPGAGVVLLHRCNDVARTPYATTPNVPLQATWIPFSVPGADRSRWPTFLYLWQPDPTLMHLSGQ